MYQEPTPAVPGDSPMYQPRRAAQSQFVPLRNLQYHVHIWGQPQPGTAPLVMVHGWMDVGASFQFVVDALENERFIIAPDWRGYGQTGAGDADNFWHPDYLADLDFLLDALCPNQAVDLLGHSMGGHVVMMYAGIRPARIRRLINLEGFGMPLTRPAQAPTRYARWMDELKALEKGELNLRPYESQAAVAQRLVKNNPRLSADKALWLAQHWAIPQADGQWQIAGHPAHKVVNAQLFRWEEVAACYAAITAPTLVVEAQDNEMQRWYQGKYTLEEFHQRLKAVPNCQVQTLADCGHMLHHDQPQALARMIESFLGA
jgi:pimeloyl-ACP methyl ester carboxylesterase